MKFFVFLTFSSLIILPSLSAHPTNPDNLKAINGKVIDAETGESLCGAEIRISGTNIITYSGFDGEFELKGLSENQTTLEITIISYKKRIIRNALLQDNLEFRLFPVENNNDPTPAVERNSKG